MEEHRIIEELTIVPLLTKYVRGEKLTALEQKTVETWISQSEANRTVFEQLKDPMYLSNDLADFDLAASTTESGLAKLNAMLDKRQSAPNRRRWFSVVAVLIAISLSMVLYLYFQSTNTTQNTISNKSAEDILPGYDQATLTFDNDKIVELNSQSIRIDRKGTTYADGTAIGSNTAQFATLSTPRKGQYKLTLSDGTKVWLNAESSLKFPTQFTDNERVVELTGEGYFEVAHNAKKPFIVKARHQKLKVLGTKFNINSYENETAIQTTLVSGKVELTNSQNNTPVILKPGQQGELFSLSSVFLVNNVDTEPFTAWTTNDFQFKATPLKEVFKQLERWYDLEIDYDRVPKTLVHGKISRDKKLSSVLYALEQITNLKFDIQKERRLVIIE